MSGSQACRGSPHGPIEKDRCHLKAETSNSFWMFTEPDTISLFCLLMYALASHRLCHSAENRQAGC